MISFVNDLYYGCLIPWERGRPQNPDYRRFSMKTKEYKNLKISEYIFITTAYVIIVGMLIYLTIRMKEVPLFYFGLTLLILRIWDIVLPKNNYVNIIRYTCRLIYISYGIYGIYLLFK